MDKSGANKAGIDTINLHLALLFMLGGIFMQVPVRQIKYLNNTVEQDHQFIKKITKPMKGFKAFIQHKQPLLVLNCAICFEKVNIFRMETNQFLNNFMARSLNSSSVPPSCGWNYFCDKASISTH